MATYPADIFNTILLWAPFAAIIPWRAVSRQIRRIIDKYIDDELFAPSAICTNSDQKNRKLFVCNEQFTYIYHIHYDRFLNIIKLYSRAYSTI